MKAMLLYRKNSNEVQSRRYMPGYLFSMSAVLRFRKWLKFIKGNIAIVRSLNI